MKTPEEVMKQFKLFPDQQDTEAARASAEKFIGWRGLQQMSDVDIFHCGFWRGAYWMQEKHRELLSLAIKLLGTDDPKLARERARKLVRQARKKE